MSNKVTNKIKRPEYIQFKDENIKLSDVFGERTMFIDEVGDILEQYTNYVCEKYVAPDSVPKSATDVKWKEFELIFPESAKSSSSPLIEFRKVSFKDGDILVSDLMGREAIDRREIFKRFYGHLVENCIVKR